MEAITLPSAQEIEARLTKVYDGKGTAIGGMYLQLAQKNAGRELTAPGIVYMFTLAVQDHVGGGEVATHVRSFIPAWIDTLVENEAVAEEAKNIHAAIVAKAQEAGQHIEVVSLEPPITDKKQALFYLARWLRNQGHEGPIQVLESFERIDRTGHYFDFGLHPPTGLFLVYEDGTVEDGYGFFVKRTKT